MTSSKRATAHDWEKIINEAIAREDWFSGFTNAVTYLEHWGYWRLRWYCIENHINMEKETKRLNISDLILVLRLLKLIDEPTYSKIKIIIKERNKLVHPSRKGISYRDRKKKERAEELLNYAKECIRNLKAGIGRKT